MGEAEKQELTFRFVTNSSRHILNNRKRGQKYQARKKPVVDKNLRRLQRDGRTTLTPTNIETGSYGLKAVSKYCLFMIFCVQTLMTPAEMAALLCSFYSDPRKSFGWWDFLMTKLFAAYVVFCFTTKSGSKSSAQTQGNIDQLRNISQMSNDDGTGQGTRMMSVKGL